MALLTDKMLFLHIPKTGGTYVRAVLEKLGIRGKEIIHTHSRFPFLNEHIDDDTLKDKLVWCFVRHPLTWYQSRWAHRCKTGWQINNPFDYYCASNDFKQFIRNCIKYWPTGWVTHEMCYYIDNIPKQCKKFIGLYEKLDEDIKIALKSSNHSDLLPRYPELLPVNTSELDGHRSYHLAVYDDETRAMVLETEKALIDKYYSDEDWLKKIQA